MQTTYIIGVSARFATKTGLWYADVYTAERQPDPACGCLGDRLRVDSELAPSLVETFKKHGAGWYDLETAAVYMGPTLSHQVVTMKYAANQPVSPFDKATNTARTSGTK